MTTTRIEVRVYYEDTDFSGVVYHARYLHFFERGRTEALRAAGVSHTDLLAREEPLAFAVRKMNVFWKAPAKIDDLLVVETKFQSLRGARMELSQVINRDGVMLASAEVEAACMALSGAPRRLPEDVRARLLNGSPEN